MKPLTFPNRPCYPVKDAVFSDPPRKPDCPVCWSAAVAAVLFILVVMVGGFR